MRGSLGRGDQATRDALEPQRGAGGGPGLVVTGFLLSGTTHQAEFIPGCQQIQNLQERPL